LASIARAAGVDPYELVQATNWDYPRSQIALPGPVGGPCLQKDPWILAESADSLGVDARISRAARITNELVPADVVAQVLRLADLGHPTAKVAIFGLAFKGRPETNDLRGSPSTEVIRLLIGQSPAASISVWDPLIASVEVDATAGNLHVAASYRDCMLGADAVVIMTNHPFFATPEFLEALDQIPPSVPVLDLWPTFNTQTGRGQLRFGAT
jgi:UDP-N-acetyl-D-mannosaminuronic acid dehydrogenase